MIHVSIHFQPPNLNPKATQAECAVAREVWRDCNQYVPISTGSQRQRSYVRQNQVIYDGPYARYLWEGHRMVDAATGRGPMYIPNVGWRWHKGAVLVPTSQPLTYHTAGTGDHWLERAKPRYLKKWSRTAGQEMSD